MKVVIQQILQETPLVRRFILRCTDREELLFEPGQFVVLTIPGLPDYSNTRSYSIASEPNGTAEFELCISINPEGKGTPVLWEMTGGTELEASIPQGVFNLRDELDLETVFICTGTGVAPFRSMIRHLFRTGVATGQIYLIFGNRYNEDILYRAEFEELAATHPQFHFIPVLSREDAVGAEHGYVHSVYLKLFADGRDARFYVCGWKEMCREARQHLKALGYNRHQYLFEDYG